MFESTVAWLLNRCLGKYVQDLDTENLNVGIFSGEVRLADLRLKPEALYELELPIEVKCGVVGSVYISIPWSGLSSRPVVFTIEDVLVVAGPVLGDMFDAELERRLVRAAKRKLVEKLEGACSFADAAGHGFMEQLIASVLSNIQLKIRNVHVRYEDTVSSPESPLSCGLCLQSLTLETTNSKWKPAATAPGASAVYQLVRAESLSIYWNPCTPPNALVLSCVNWRHAMNQGLQTFSINGEDFDFIVKPVSAKAKLIGSRLSSPEARVPRLLVDVVVQDAAVQLARAQLVSAGALHEAFQRMARNRPFREFHPGVNPHCNAVKWWHYAYTAVLEQRVRPYSWRRIQQHREHCRQYREAYTRTLLSPHDTELRLDLQQLEDHLGIVDIVIAREEAKMRLNPDKVALREEKRCWLLLDEPPELRLEVHGTRERGLWSRLTPQEREKLCDAIGYVRNETDAQDKPKQYIQHKFNFTLANLSVSLLSHGHEIAVATLTQLLASLETRPFASAFRFSARAEGLVVEGAGAENNELVPLVSADALSDSGEGGAASSPVFAFDLERNPLAHDTDYALSISLEPLEVVYDEHTLSELLGFFHTPSLARAASIGIQRAKQASRGVLEFVMSRRKTLHLSLDLKGPYIVFPELGSLQRGGHVLVVDMGCLTVRTELQSGPLDEATQSELEESLYDRIHAELDGFQVLFCDGGDEWREAKRRAQDSELLHLIPRVRAAAVLASSVRPNYRPLPRHKLNVSLASLKLNVSERRLAALLEFADVLPLPAPNSLHCSGSAVIPLLDPDDLVPLPPRAPQLRAARSVLVTAHLARQQLSTGGRSPAGLQRDPTMDADNRSSDQSDDEQPDLWAKTMDQPGFEDNVSPHNVIDVLMRFTLGEAVIQAAARCGGEEIGRGSERPYLMLRVAKVCVEAALLEYGPALQVSVGVLQLVDKAHAEGRYLELLSAEVPSQDVFTLLYRKVRADCPDFKSHFHSVEQSLVVELAALQVTFHREALLSLATFLSALASRVHSRDSTLGVLLSSTPHNFSLQSAVTWLMTGCGGNDPPVPPGATKFSCSARLGEAKLRLCDLDLDFLELKMAGLEADCVLKANERAVVRFFLASLHMEDLSDITLYPKVLYAAEGDHVLDLKLVRHSPKLRGLGSDATRSHVKSTDGNLRARLGRLHVVVSCKLLKDLQRFLDPFLSPGTMHATACGVASLIQLQADTLRQLRLQLALELNMPTLLLPQKSDSPNLVVVDMGQLSVENFFKQDMENVLIRLEGVQLARAVMTLAGSLEAQEPVLEPASIRLDVKRACYPAAAPLLQVSGAVEYIRVNLGQRDLATLLSVWSENLSEFAESSSAVWAPLQSDPNVTRLQAFFCQGEKPRPESCVRLSLDTFTLTLFCDIDEVLSSPVRDMEHGLCRLQLSEASLTLDTRSDQSMEMRASLQTCRLDDIRAENNVYVKKILESHSGESQDDQQPHNVVSVSTPPIFDLSLRQAPSGDRVLDAVVERTRLNLSVPFLANLCRFLMDALPGERPETGGLINHGFECGFTHATPRPKTRLRRSDPEVVFCKRCTEQGDFQAGLNVSLQLRQPEILLLGDPLLGPALLVRAELVLDYNLQPAPGPHREVLNISLSQLQVLSKRMNGDQAREVLAPCDVELSRQGEECSGVKVTVNVSPVLVRVWPSVIHSLCGMMDEVAVAVQAEEPAPVKPSRLSLPFLELEDLWSPKKIPPCVPLELSSDGGGSACCSNCLRRRAPCNTEVLNLAVPRVHVMFEISENVAVLSCKSSMTATAHDWSTQLRANATMQIRASYHNTELDVWEPLLEPWDLNVHILHARAFPVLCNKLQQRTIDEPVDQTVQPSSGNKTHDDSSGDDDDVMTFVRPRHVSASDSATAVAAVNSREDSDSEGEEGVMERLAASIGRLFSGDDSSAGNSEDEDSSQDEDEHVQERLVSNGNCPADVLATTYNESLTAATYVLVSARDKLDITLTSTALTLLYELLSSFDRDAPFLCKNKPPIDDMPSSLLNHLGPESKVALLCRSTVDGTETELFTASHELQPRSEPSSTAASSVAPSEEAILDADSELQFEGGFTFTDVVSAEDVAASPPKLVEDVAKMYRRLTDQRISIEVSGFQRLLVPAPCLQSSLYAMQPTRNNTRYHVVTVLQQKGGSQEIVVRSPLQVRNETSCAIGLFYRKSVLDALGVPHMGESTNPFEDAVRVTIVEPDETFDVPLFVAYHCRLFVQAAHLDNCAVSDTGIWWPELSTHDTTPKDLVCPVKNKETGAEGPSAAFAVRALVCAGPSVQRPKSQQHSAMVRDAVPNFVVRLLPPLVVLNELPYALEFRVPSSGLLSRLEAGGKAHIYTLGLTEPLKINIEVPAYLGVPWSGSFTLTPELEDKHVAMAAQSDTEGGNKQLGLSVRVSRHEECELRLYAPYWIVNKTKMPVQIRGAGSDVVYESQGEEPLLFSFKRRHQRLGKRAALRLRVCQSSWSSAFSPDAAGCTGLVVCRDRERGKRYRVLAATSLPQLCPHLTRVVTFLPCWLVSNRSRKNVRFMEDNERADLWIDLAPGQSTTFWPETDTMRMFVKMRGSQHVSQAFPVDQRHTTVLRMDKGCGLTVEVVGGNDNSFSVVFRNYCSGDALVRVDNMCEELVVRLQQRGAAPVMLGPGHSLLYTWDEPCKERVLLWSVTKDETPHVAEFWSDGYGHVSITTARGVTTAAPPPASSVSSRLSAGFRKLSARPSTDPLPGSEDDEQQQSENGGSRSLVFWVSYLEGRQRVLLITRDDVIASQARALVDSDRNSSLELCLSLAGIGLSLCSAGREIAYASLVDSAPVWEVLGSHRWKTLPPELAAWAEQRWGQGLQRAQVRDFVHIDLEKMQMTKPFYGELRRRHSPGLWLQYRRSDFHSYLHCRLHRLQVDNQQPDAIFPCVLYPLPQRSHTDNGPQPCLELVLLRRHRGSAEEIVKCAKLLLGEFVVNLERGFVVSLYTAVRSWLPASNESTRDFRARSDIASLHQPVPDAACAKHQNDESITEYLFLAPVVFRFSYSARGVQKPDCSDAMLASLLSLPEVWDVRLRLGALEQRGGTTNGIFRAWQHYTSQLAQQFHAHVLGLEVLGSPYCDPEPSVPPQRGQQDELSEGLALAALTLLGHVAGGPSTVALLGVPTADLLSSDAKRRTGTVLPQDLPATVLEASNSLIMGVALGLTGLFPKQTLGDSLRKTIMGGQDGGDAEAFFRGPGKGVLGLMTRQGEQDCVAMACDALKRAVEAGEIATVRTRLPRYLNPCHGVRRFCWHLAAGQELLRSLGRFADTDTYWAHAPLDNRRVGMVTMQHVILVMRGGRDIWDVDWAVGLDNVVDVPHVVADKLIFKIRQDDVQQGGGGGASNDNECCFFQSKDLAALAWLQHQAETVMIVAMQSKPCSTLNENV